MTFGVWALVKGKAATYWSFASTPNASKGASSDPSPTSAAVTIPIGSQVQAAYAAAAQTTAGTAAAGGTVVPTVPPVPPVPPVSGP